MKRKIAVDIDNTIWDLVSPWIDLYNRSYDDNVEREDITRYDFFTITSKASREEILNFLSTEDIWQSVEPYKESYEYLEKLNNEYELYIVTNTSYKTPKAKFDRLFSLFPFLSEDQLVIISNKQLLNIDIMVDDCMDHLCGGNFIKFLIDEPYNRNECEDKEIIRVKNLKEVYMYLNNIEKKDDNL